MGMAAQWSFHGVRLGARPEPKTEIGTSDQERQRRECEPVTRDPVRVSPQGQLRLRGMAQSHSRCGLTIALRSVRWRLQVRVGLGCVWPSLWEPNAGPARHPGPPGRPTGVGGAGRNGL